MEGCPLSTKVAELQDSCLSYEALARIAEKSKDRSFLPWLSRDPTPSLLCGLPERGKWDPWVQLAPCGAPWYTQRHST